MLNRLVAILFAVVFVAAVISCAGDTKTGDETRIGSPQPMKESLKTPTPFQVSTPTVLSVSPNPQDTLDKKLASDTVIAFWDTIRNNRNIESFLEDSASVEKIQAIVEELSKYEKMKVVSSRLFSFGSLYAKVCDREGFCDGYITELTQEEDERWKIYEVRRADEYDWQRYRVQPTVSESEPSKIAKEFFTRLLIEKRDPLEVSDLVARRMGTSTLPVSLIAKEGIARSFNRVEILGRIPVLVACETLFADNTGLSHKYTFNLRRTTNHKFQITSIGTIPDEGGFTPIY